MPMYIEVSEEQDLLKDYALNLWIHKKLGTCVVGVATMNSFELNTLTFQVGLSLTSYHNTKHRFTIMQFFISFQTFGFEF